MSLITIAVRISEELNLDTRRSDAERIAGVALAIAIGTDEPGKIAYNVAGLEFDTAGKLRDAIWHLVAKAMITQHDHDAFARAMQDFEGDEGESEHELATD